MTNERLILAIGQIERALSRIEAAWPGKTASVDSGSNASISALAADNEALKRAANEAVRRIDALIGPDA